MDKIIFTTITMLFFLNQIAICQEVTHNNGARYIKKTEYNIAVNAEEEKDIRYNLQGKGVFERVLFGKVNSPVEFMFDGRINDSREVLGFRIINNKRDNSYQLEIMRIPKDCDLYELETELSSQTSRVNLPSKLKSVMTQEQLELIRANNDSILYRNIYDNLFKPYRPKANILIISKAFAEKIQDKVTNLIDSFVGKGRPIPDFASDIVTFRSVVGDEVWSLNISKPQTEALKLSDIFLKISNITDNKINESEYMQLLDQL